MVEMEIVYEGHLRCKATHLPSGSVITTDAPKDNEGQGAAFSPTDLVGAALGTCAMTVMGIFARRHGINLDGSRARVTKEMTATPVRRIGKLTVVLTLPKAVAPEHRPALEAAARTCPVHKSLHLDIDMVLRFEYA